MYIGIRVTRVIYWSATLTPKINLIGKSMTDKSDSGISLTPPEPITPENIKDKMVSDDELRRRIINGELVDEKLEATLFTNGKPSK